PPRHVYVPRPNRPRREVPARDAAPLPVRADGAEHAVHAVARRVVPPRGGGEAPEGDRRRGGARWRELRARRRPAVSEHVVPARPRDVRLRARRGRGEGPVQDARERRGAADLPGRGRGEGAGPRPHRGWRETEGSAPGGESGTRPPWVRWACGPNGPGGAPPAASPGVP